MTQKKQRDELQATIWSIANDLRGAIGGWDFVLAEHSHHANLLRPSDPIRCDPGPSLP